MAADNIRERNLLALSSNNAEIAYKLGLSRVSDRIKIIDAKNGSPVPYVFWNGRWNPLHSTIDPLREGEKVASIYPNAHFLIVFGLGAAYHIHPFLKRESTSQVIIIDTDIEMVNFLITHIDFRSLFLDNRTVLLVDKDPDDISNYLLDHYIPAFNGNLQTCHLRPRVGLDQEYFKSMTTVIRNVLNDLADDFSVQTYFGKKWLLNTLFNLPYAEKSAAALPPVRKACIIGAGPSLSGQMKILRQLKPEAGIIATDTSLPFLLHHKIKPDIIISIDCQHITYHHFLKGLPENVPLVLDLASPNVLTRRSSRTVFITSKHPFSFYINQNWRRFPIIDTSGGNVSHAAVSLAANLGAESIYLFGVDFSYPNGECYANGTYLYNYFETKNYRTSNQENFFFSFIHRNANVKWEKIRKNEGIRYLTNPMLNYKHRLEILCNSLPVNITQIEGNGLALHLRKNTDARRFDRIFFSAGPPRYGWSDFLKEYRQALIDLPVPSDPFASYYHDLSSNSKDIWTTLLPAAASFQRGHSSGEVSPRSLMEQVRSWTIRMVDNILRYHSPVR